jgi:hypothetical protein
VAGDIPSKQSWIGANPVSSDALMSWLKYFLIIVVAAGWYALPFLNYLLDSTLSYWLFLIFCACCVLLFFVSLSGLFRRNWKAVAIFAPAWVLAVLPLFDLEPVGQLRFWLYVQGFRIHVAPVEQYLSSKCELVEFVEDSIKQQLGECEYRMQSSYSWNAVFYDTTGQFALPPAQRTQEWKDAMYNFSSHCYLTEKAIADPVLENFYQLEISGTHVGGGGC